MKQTPQHDYEKRVGYWSDPGIIDILARCLDQGGVVAGDSDTILGLLATVTPAGFQALNRIKERERKPYLVLLGSQALVHDIACIAPDSYVPKLAEHCWPGPLTIILPAQPTYAAYDPLGRATIAVRVPDHVGLQALLARIPMLFSTSANRTGRPAPATAQELDPLIRVAAAYVVLNASGSTGVVPSTIIDCTTYTPRMVREGAYTREYLETILQRPIL